MNLPFLVSYGWKDFDNTSKLTPYQKHRIKKRYTEIVREAIQETINESVGDRSERRQELEAHTNPKDPFKLDIGGEG